MEYNSLLIKSFDFFELYLHPNQCYLGRTYLWIKREGVINFFEINQQEREELYQLGQSVTETIDRLFAPNLFNYASLGNVCPSLHIHIVPRYQTKRFFGGIEFIDDRYGQNYAPYDKGFTLPTLVREELIITIRGALCNTTKRSH
ncbi:MAG: hypothetical protein KDK55_03980 [Chlamydiia bacterium]|nr:hypothetical protein [Chlamydiia bacterium]